MDARQMLAKLDGYGGIIPFNSEELEVTLRALRLLAAAEANDGGIPEMTKAVQEGRGIELGCQFERERNGLAARVAELEAERCCTCRDGALKQPYSTMPPLQTLPWGTEK